MNEELIEKAEELVASSQEIFERISAIKTGSKEKIREAENMVGGAVREAVIHTMTKAISIDLKKTEDTLNVLDYKAKIKAFASIIKTRTIIHDLKYRTERINTNFSEKIEKIKNAKEAVDNDFSAFSEKVKEFNKKSKYFSESTSISLSVLAYKKSLEDAIVVFKATMDRMNGHIERLGTDACLKAVVVLIRETYKKVSDFSDNFSLFFDRFSKLSEVGKSNRDKHKFMADVVNNPTFLFCGIIDSARILFRDMVNIFCNPATDRHGMMKDLVKLIIDTYNKSIVAWSENKYFEKSVNAGNVMESFFSLEQIDRNKKTQIDTINLDNKILDMKCPDKDIKKLLDFFPDEKVIILGSSGKDSGVPVTIDRIINSSMAEAVIDDSIFDKLAKVMDEKRFFSFFETNKMGSDMLKHFKNTNMVVVADGKRLPGYYKPDDKGEIYINGGFSSVIIGLEYNAEIETLPVVAGEDRAGFVCSNINRMTINCQTKPGDITSDSLMIRQANSNKEFVAKTSPVSREVKSTLLAPDWSDVNYVVIRHAEPEPVSISHYTAEVAVGSRNV